jgi:hypothetical protein
MGFEDKFFIRLIISSRCLDLRTAALSRSHDPELVTATCDGLITLAGEDGMETCRLPEET